MYKFIKYLTQKLAVEYEKKIFDELNFLCKKPKLFVDVGTHKGEFIDNFFSKYGFMPRVIGFEPQKKFYNFLKKKYKNKKNVTFNNIALTNKKGNVVFNISHHERSSSIKKINKKSFYYLVKSLIFFGSFDKNFIKKRELISSNKLDNLIKKKIDILKIDCEGEEYNVLLGASKLIKDKKINIIVIEILTHSFFQDYSAKKIIYFLEKNNFYLHKRFKFPFYNFEDRIYVQKKN